MSHTPLQTRLKALAGANRAVAQLIGRLARLADAAPEQPPPADEATARAELAAEIQAGLKELESEFELAKQDAEDVTSLGAAFARDGRPRRRGDSERERERVAIATQVERLGDDLVLARTRFHKAQLQASRQAQRRAALRAQRDRERLLEGAAPTNERRAGRRRADPQASADERARDAAGDVTAALRRTHAALATELQRSAFAHETLQRSTQALQGLHEGYASLDGLLASSRTLVGTLLRSTKSDTWYLENALRLLAYTLAWLVFRRLVYGPLLYLVVYPLRYFVFAPLGHLARALLSIVSLLLGSAAGSPSTTSSLRVPPSATGRMPTRNRDMPAQSVRVGAGGDGARQAQGDQPMDEIGRMAEQTREEERGAGAPAQKEKRSEPAAGEGAQEEAQEQGAGRGEEQGAGHDEAEGSGLRERRGEEGGPNPKKRMWEEPPETPEAGRARDEL